MAYGRNKLDETQRNPSLQLHAEDAACNAPIAPNKSPKILGYRTILLVILSLSFYSLLVILELYELDSSYNKNELLFREIVILVISTFI